MFSVPNSCSHVRVLTARVNNMRRMTSQKGFGTFADDATNYPNRQFTNHQVQWGF